VGQVRQRRHRPATFGLNFWPRRPTSVLVIAARPSSPEAPHRGHVVGGPPELADYLLLLFLRGHASGVWFDPQPGGSHRVSIEHQLGALGTLHLGGGAGDALLARLALITGVDLLARGSRAGTAQVRAGAARADVVFTLRTTDHGLGGELRLVEPRPAAVTDEGSTGAEELDAGARVGPYLVLRVLGRGGMGIVYEVEHTLLRKTFAMKVLLRSVMASDPPSARRFLREARAAARIRHPGIIDVSDLGSLPDGRPFLVMERLRGRPVIDVIRADGALEPGRAISLARQIAEALRAAHGAGVVHRDLTSLNVFVLDEGGTERAVVLDFGAANTPDPDEADLPDGPPGTVLGTPLYMPPELIQGKPTDHRADLYGLGVMLFEMLTGAPPYLAATAREVVRMHIRAPVPTPDSPFGPLPEDLRRMVAQLLAKSPDDRPASVGAVLAELGRIEPMLQRAGWRRYLPQ
jgi:eukaryotic-like serine/threonine-protein kinase